MRDISKLKDIVTPVYGVDVGGSSVKLGRFDSKDLTLLRSWRINTDLLGDSQMVLERIALEIKEDIENEEIKPDYVVGIGIGVPGPVVGGIINKGINLDWESFNVEATLKEMTGMKVCALNDANAAALGEYWNGAGKGYKNIVMLTLGTGVGGGIILNGNLENGFMGGAGEVGHICVNYAETEECRCGHKGCLEQYIGNKGIVKLFLKNGGEDDPKRELHAKDVFEMAKTGDKAAQQAMDEASEILGVAMAGIASVINPEVFVIGGGISNSGDAFIRKAETAFKAHAFHAVSSAKILRAGLNDESGIYGAAGWLLKNRNVGD